MSIYILGISYRVKLLKQRHIERKKAIKIHFFSLDDTVNKYIYIWLKKKNHPANNWNYWHRKEDNSLSEIALGCFAEDVFLYFKTPYIKKTDFGLSVPFFNFLNVLLFWYWFLYNYIK